MLLKRHPTHHCTPRTTNLQATQDLARSCWAVYDDSVAVLRQREKPGYYVASTAWQVSACWLQGTLGATRARGLAGPWNSVLSTRGMPSVTHCSVIWDTRSYSPPHNQQLPSVDHPCLQPPHNQQLRHVDHPCLQPPRNQQLQWAHTAPASQPAHPQA